MLCHATKLQRIAQSLQASLGQEGRYVQPLNARCYDADVLSTLDVSLGWREDLHENFTVPLLKF